MKLQFLGTGAADHDWSGKNYARGSTSTLIDGHLLIDAGITGWENLEKSHVDPSAIDTLLITHTHDDHFLERVIVRIAEARRQDLPPLRIYLSPQGAERLAPLTDRIQLFPVTYAQEFDVPGFHVVTLQGNHRVSNLKEECFHFMLLSEKQMLLYLLDGAWMTTKTRALIGKRKADAVVWEATMADAGNWRIFEHSDLSMLDQMKQVLFSDGVFDEKTLFFVTHIARTLWPEAPEVQDSLAASHGYTMTHDLMTFEF